MLRAAKFAGVPVTEALGLPWSVTVERWCQIAEAAESQAEAHFHDKARRDAERRR